MKAEFIFSDKTTADSEIIIDDNAAKTEVFYNDLKHADNSCKFKLPYSIALANRIKADLQNNIKCYIKNDDNSNYFCGYIRKNINFEKTQQNQPVSMELVSPSFLLDKTLTKATVYINKTITFIITDLLAKAGFTDIKTIGVTDTLSVCSFSEDDNIKDVIDEILKEYKKTYDFNNDGYFYTSDILNVPETESISQRFTGFTRESIKIEAKERDADYVEATWNKIEYKENTLLFSDTSGQTDDEKCKITVSAGKYFANEHYNYLEYDSTFGTVVYVSSITPKIKADSGITYKVTRTDEYGNDLGTKCMLVAENDSSDDADITQLDIYGNAYINTGTNTNISTTGTKKKSVTLDYLHTEESVKNFVSALANYYRYADNTITLKSTVDFAPGSFVSVSDYGIGTYYGRIIQKISRLNTKAVEYKIETISDFTPAEVGSTKTNYNGKNSASISTYHDFTAPTVPAISGISINNNGYASISITASTDSESGVSYYKLYRKEGNEAYSVLTMLNHTGQNIIYIDKTVRKGNSYSYCVSAVDKVGNSSAQSAAKTITAKVTAAPNPATSLTAVANTADFIKLAWTEAVTDTEENKAAYYIVSVSRDSGKTWTVCDKSYGTLYYYYYDRSVDKYPEAAALKTYRFHLQTVSVNDVSASSYALTAVDYSTYGTWIPSAPTVKATAEEDGIRLTWSDSNSSFYGSITYTPVITYSGTARTVAGTKEKSFFYTFDRALDCYPEKSTLSGASKYLKNYRIAVTAKDEKSGSSATSTAAAPDESSYLQWLPVAPTIQSSVAGRNVTLILSESAPVYGSFRYRIQIKKLSATADTAFYKPDLAADPYSALTAYKNGSGFVTTAGNTFSQTLPLNGQNDSSPAPVATSYQYSIVAENKSGAGTAASTITVTALVTGATDLADLTITENKIAPHAVTADKIHGKTITADKMAATDLAAGSAYFSKIAGNKGADANNFWSGLDSTTPELRVGNDIALENSNNDDAEYLHYIPKAETTGLKRAAGFYMKIKNFIISAVASIVLGLFRVKNKGATDANSFMTVNPTDSADSTTGTPARTVNINGKVFTSHNSRFGLHSLSQYIGTISYFRDAVILLCPANAKNGTVNTSLGDGQICGDFYLYRSQGHCFTRVYVDVGFGYSWSFHSGGMLKYEGTGNYYNFKLGTCLYNGALYNCLSFSTNMGVDGGIYFSGFYRGTTTGFGTCISYKQNTTNTATGTTAGKIENTEVNSSLDTATYNYYSTEIEGNVTARKNITVGGTVQAATGKITDDMSVGGALNVAGAQTNTGLITANGGVKGNVTGNLTGNALTASHAVKADTSTNLSGGVCAPVIYKSLVPIDSTANAAITAPLFLCAASFHWTGSAVVILDSLNIKSITRYDTGRYTIKLINSLYSKEVNGNAGYVIYTGKFVLSGYIHDSSSFTNGWLAEVGFYSARFVYGVCDSININTWDNQTDSAVDPCGCCGFRIDYISE